MNDRQAVTRVVERILVEDLEPLLALSAEDIAFGVITPGRMPARCLSRGRRCVAEYFQALGGIVTFWRVRCLPVGDRVLVLGHESFTTNGGLVGGGDFALVFESRDGLIIRLLVIEDAEDAFHSRGGKHADDHHGGRDRDLLQGLGHGTAGRLQPRLAVERGRLGGPDAVPGRPRVPLHRA